MRKFDRFLIATMFVFLFICVGINNYQINKISGVYFDNSILEKIDTLDYKPTNLIDANVIVKNKQSRGSGSIIKVTKNATYILTAAHVIYEEKVELNMYGKLEKMPYKSKNITVTVKNKKYKSLIIKVDEDLDVAVIKIFKHIDIEPVKIAKKEPKLGDIVWSVSNPGKHSNVINRGVISAIEEDGLYVSTASYFGSSGGMVVNTKGEQIGVISTIWITTVNSYFPSLTVFNGVTRTKDLNKFLKGIL